MSLSLHQIFNDSVSIDSSLTYRFGQLPKPCVYPFTTPLRHQLGGFEMSDHVWHRGLWFTIKFINGTNFWEENAPYGVQVTRGQPRCELLASDTVRISTDLDWTSDATGKVIEESRTLTFREWENGVRGIDWASELRPMIDLTLDRTPFTTWGGYGGLSFRGSRELHKAGFLLPSGETTGMLKGEKHDWVVMQGLVDGGVNRQVSLGMIDHPSNPRSPSPWYGKTLDFNFINAAFLFHEPMHVKKGEPLRFQYRVLWRDGTWARDEFADLAKTFCPSGDAR